MKNIQFLLGPLFILIYLSDLMKSADKRSVNQKSCILANSNWDSIYSRSNMIPDPSTCTTIADDCCHFYLSYKYNYIPVEKSYCFTMTGKPEAWLKKFNNLYQDEQIWLSSFFNNNYELFHNVGNSLEYIYHQNYTCLETFPATAFSTYNFTNCAVFNTDGSCKIQNDYNNFQNFITDLYQNVSTKACTGYDELGKCKEFQSDPKSNNTALFPLLEILKKDYFHSLENGDGNLSTNNDTSNEINKWPGPCRNISSVKIKITCSPAYTQGNFIIFSLYKIIFFFIFVLLL
jgi:hypothetical protein